MTTPLYPTFRKHINDAINQLIQNQITPWSFLNSGKPLRIYNFDKKQISYDGNGFEGSPREVFWSRYIEPFLEDICISEIAAAIEMAKQRNVDAKLLLPEIQDLLSAGVRKVFSQMAEVDRRLRGKGFPDKVHIRTTDTEIKNMNEFIEERILAELAMLKTCSKDEISLQNTKFDNVIYFFKNHWLGAFIGILILIIISLGTLTDSIDKILSFKEKRLNSSIIQSNDNLPVTPKD
jgi:hypothetical protein